MKRKAFAACLLAFGPLAWAGGLWNGTWVQRSESKAMILTMTVEDAGSGSRVTYRAGRAGSPPTEISSFLTQADGKDVPHLANGKPTGQTFGIKRIDGRHWVTVLKYNGQQTGTSKAELSPDGKVLRIDEDNPVTSPNGLAGKHVQYWDKR